MNVFVFILDTRFWILYTECTMQLSNIKEFLAKYQERLTHEEDRQEIIFNTLNFFVHGAIKKDSFSAEKGVLKIHANPVIKNELFIYKENILQRLHEGGRTDILEIQ